jgi:hypothetical protein
MGVTERRRRERHEELLTYLLANDEFKGNAALAKELISARYVLFHFLSGVILWYLCISQPGSRKESMLATLRRIRETYGSVENCVKERCQLTDEDIERIRGHLVVDATEGNGAVDWALHAKLV